ncbi:UPF0496 protein 4 [Musa troglodytarum]|uniref:UPF0496 protein 4 n=1 Tax=Musa troglodytarum TaxID=320322 RepID=A0A9E7FQU1_9LILI|nr:UPF0496 protein 4 [Musa troglodytarum]
MGRPPFGVAPSGSFRRVLNGVRGRRYFSVHCNRHIRALGLVDRLVRLPIPLHRAFSASTELFI